MKGTYNLSVLNCLSGSQVAKINGGIADFRKPTILERVPRYSLYFPVDPTSQTIDSSAAIYGTNGLFKTGHFFGYFKLIHDLRCISSLSATV
jgi:hypothetical protein